MKNKTDIIVKTQNVRDNMDLFNWETNVPFDVYMVSATATNVLLKDPFLQLNTASYFCVVHRELWRVSKVFDPNTILPSNSYLWLQYNLQVKLFPELPRATSSKYSALILPS
jgi:hypothetical protein